jgi:2-methylisocitrate lyase-like PEP mutase family enzyme
MRTQAEKGALFQQLHERAGAFIIPNPWDVGTARLLAHLGFEALATTSAGFAFSIGQRDNTVGRDAMMAHVAAIARATDLPTSADLENGFGDEPEAVANTIGLAAAAGLAGCSIEDMSNHDSRPIYPLELAVERIHAAVGVARSLPCTFTLTARCENYLVGKPDLADTIQRLQAYQAAGADVLYAPGLRTREEIATLVRAVDRPVNVIMGLQGVRLSLAELAELGVKRVSVGGSLCRAALGAFLRAAREMHDKGTFNYADEAISHRDLSAMFGV